MQRTQQKVYPHPCNRCVIHHRACNRVWPCSGCGTQHDCVYARREKRIKIKDETYKTYNRKETELMSVNNLRQHSEFFMQHLTGYIPIMLPKDLKELFNYHKLLGENKKPRTIPSLEKLALFYGIQALSFGTQGHKERAHQLYHDALRLINQCANGMKLELFNNTTAMSYELAATYFHIGTYIGNRGDFSTGIFFLRLARSYLPRSENSFCHILTRALQGRLLLLEHRGVVPHRGLNVKYNSSTEVGDDYTQMFEKHGEYMPENALTLIKFGILFYTKGGILQAERLRNNNDHLLPVAKEITEATKVDYFALIAPTTTTAIVEASILQRKHYLIAQDKDTKEELAQDLKQNLTALNVMAARSELVGILHGEFIAELTRFLDVYEELENRKLELKIGSSR